MDYRLGQAAQVLGVSVDTVRRYADSGKLASSRTRGGQRRIDGLALARFAESQGDARASGRSSARNRLFGVVTRVVQDRVAAQVEMRCGPFRIVAILSREAVESLGLAPGVLANAVVKATNVVVELVEIPDSAEDE